MTPDSALTTVDLPCATCPMVPTLIVACRLCILHLINYISCTFFIFGLVHSSFRFKAEVEWLVRRTSHTTSALIRSIGMLGDAGLAQHLITSGVSGVSAATSSLERS